MDIKVSVLLITYNQEKYIRNALESILSQKTSFMWELLIGEDASTDATAEIIKQTLEQSPDNCTIRTYFRSENVGASKNLFELIRNAKGDYITVLEGDDYWLGESRIQDLADYLDQHSSLVGVSHKRERRQNEQLIAYDPEDGVVGKTITLRDYCGGKRFSAMACLFRNLYSHDYDGYEHTFTGARNACDQVMCYTILSQGDIFVLDKVYGVYRLFSGGYCTQKAVISRAMDSLAQNRRILEYYPEAKDILKEIRSVHATIIKAHFKEKGLLSALKYYRNIAKHEKTGILYAAIEKAFRKKLRRRV